MVDQDVIFASETVGVTTSEVYMPCYLVGYRMSLDAVEKLRHAGAKRIFITHVGNLDSGKRGNGDPAGIKEGRILRGPGMGLSGSGIETDKR